MCWAWALLGARPLAHVATINVLFPGFIWLLASDVNGPALLVAAVLVAVVTPIAFWPFSKTIWLAIDLQFRPPEPGEVGDEYSW